MGPSEGSILIRVKHLNCQVSLLTDLVEGNTGAPTCSFTLGQTEFPQIHHVLVLVAQCQIYLLSYIEPWRHCFSEKSCLLTEKQSESKTYRDPIQTKMLSFLGHYMQYSETGKKLPLSDITLNWYAVIVRQLSFTLTIAKCGSDYA